MYIYQQKTLDEAHCILPNARWWIKGDGVDLTCSLQESVTGEWNGDVDLGDKILQLLRSEYLSRVESTQNSIKEFWDLNQVLDTSSRAATRIHRIQYLIHNVEQDLNRICECKLGYISCPSILCD